MSQFYCVQGHGLLVVTHETMSHKTYSCTQPQCKYSKTVKTPGGWALDLGKMVLGGIISGAVGAEMGDIIHHDPGSNS
jgi:hypothetical protein